MGAQPNKFQFILDTRGVETDVLTQAPESWLKTAIKFTRSKTYMGVFRGESLPTVFVTSAARILRREFYKYGVLANVKQTINLFNANNWLYNTIYRGKLDFSTADDGLTSFTVNSISDDFTVKLNANDSTDYSIPLDVDEAVNLELTPLALKEQADLSFTTTSDFRSHAFFEISISNNQQNSVNASVHETGFLAQIPAVFDDTQPNWFYVARMNTNVKISGSIQSSVNSGHYQFNIYKSGGVLVKTLADVTYSVTTQTNMSWDFVAPLLEGEKLFFYIIRLDSINTFQGVNMQSGTMHLEYSTISPASMCKAVPASYLFGKLLQAMNTNTNSSPNQPVVFKSDLLTGPLADLLITSSDSIRLAQGSLYRTGDTLFPGTYQVISGSVNYANGTFTAGTSTDTFSFVPDQLSFTGTGVAQRTTSGYVGNVFNEGDDLPAGGTFRVGGEVGSYATYNGISYNVGLTFKYVLGQESFLGSNDTVFVEQIAFVPQIITNFKDFFQTIYGVQGGNCAFGIETIAGAPTCFIENLDYVYRATVGNLNAGKVDTAIKITPAKELLGNTVKVGYKNQQYSQLNGFSEVNSQQLYATVLDSPQKEINLQCIYRADPYGIEEVRITQNDTAASRSDNDTFIIWKKTLPEETSPITYYHPLRTEGLKLNTTTGEYMITGVDPSYYNWILSPKRNLLRGGNYLASIFYNMKGYKLTLSAAPKNTTLVTTDINGLRVAEADPVNISNLPPPLFLPFYATFKPGLPTNALQMIDSLPYGFIRFTYNGKQYKMFADTVTVDIGQNTEQEFKGLMTPDNDLTQLVH